MKNIDENVKQELIQKALSIYKDGDRINQKNAYKGVGNSYILKKVNIDTICVQWGNYTENTINVSIDGAGVYTSKYGIWAEIKDRIIPKESLLTTIL